MNQAMSTPLRLAAPAKINLHLEVLGKRPDGFHEIESLMITISLADELVISQAAKETTVHCDREDFGPIEDNLVTRAAKLVREESGREDGIEIRLSKRIPVGAGLGGGSSDAATTLAGLNTWWNLGWERDRLAELGARLGSDVPFFFHAPAAIVRGRGEIVESTPVGRRFHGVLVSPPERLSTRAVFEKVMVPKETVDVTPIAGALAAGDVAGVAQRLHNRLQSAAEGLCEAVAAIRRDASSWTCLGHLMTGSGSSYYALCETREQASSLANLLESKNLGTIFKIHSC